MALRTVRQAKWVGDQYVVTDTGTDDEWYSSDGYDWVDQLGKPVVSKEFEGSRIVLCGGPLDGKSVS